MVKGQAEEVKQLHDQIEALDLPLFPWHGSAKPIFIRLVPATISGRSFQVVDNATWTTPTTGARHTSPE